MQFEFSNECTMDFVVKCNGCGGFERFEGSSFLELVHGTAEDEGWDMGSGVECSKAMDATMVEAMRDAGHADCPNADREE